MKKVLLSSVLLLCVQQSVACVQEAQITAHVKGRQIMQPDACFVVLEPKGIKFYSQNEACPLDLTQVINSGFEVGMVNEDQCSFNIGDEVSGLIYKDVDGTLRLRR